MSISLYMDEHVPSAITEGLRRLGVDVMTAQDDGFAGSADPDLLDRASKLERVMVTSDHDFEVEAARRQRAGIAFSGIIYINLLSLPIGKCIDELALISLAGVRGDLANYLQYLPL